MALILPIASKFDNSGLKKAKKEFGGLGKSIKGALGVAGIAVGFSAVTNLIKESVKQAQEDIISQKMLARQLRVTIHATKGQIAAQEDYISKLSLTTGIVDDRLRPAYATLLRVTGNSKKAQELLNVSLDTAAGTGKNLEIVTKSVGRAYLGNVTGLQKLVPGIKKGSDAIGFLKKNFKDARSTLASPFDRMQVAVDELKEKFGKLLLPEVIKFVDYLTITVVPAVSKFLDQVANPKTDAGKAFKDIKDAVRIAFQSVSDFFALFGDGDAMKGFANMAKSLASSLPALLALKGIMTLASAGKTIANLIAAMVAIKGGGGDGVTPVVGGKGGKLGGKGGLLPLAGLAGTAALVLAIPGSSDMSIPDRAPSVPWKKGSNSVQIGKAPTVVVNSYGSTPADFVKLVHEAVKKSDRLNGTK
jgi:hypothetical protein